MAGPVAADVPARYDVVVSLGGGTTYGFMLADEIEPNLPFRSHKAVYSISPTFVERSNVSNTYGDNAQDFFLTVLQRDWSLGEQQKYFRAGVDGRYWMGSNVDVSTPGQVNLSPTIGSVSFATAPVTGSRKGLGLNVAVASSTHVYSVTSDGAVSDNGSHGLGAAPGQFGMCSDGANNYLSSTAAGSVGVIKWDGTTFTSFSATKSDSLAFVNNALYGFNDAATDLVQYDSTGNATAVGLWRGADGAVTTANLPIIITPYGGQLLILFAYGQEAAELWIYDGTGVRRLEVFPENFWASDMDVLYGVAYIAGGFLKTTSSPSAFNLKPAIMFYDGSQIGNLWEANTFNTTSTTNTNVGFPVVGVSNGHLIFTDDTTGNFMSYNPALGGVSSIGSFVSSGTSPRLISSGFLQVHIRDQTNGYYLPTGTYPSSGYVISSLIDFDSSLTKQFRGVKVTFDAAADGNGGSVDIAYQVDSLSGAWINLQVGATSGVEYTLPGVSGHAIATRITINKGTSTVGPTLKNVAVRGAPLMLGFRRREYTFHCYGPLGAASGVRLRDGTYHPKSGYQQSLDLLTIANQTVPFSIVDKFGAIPAALVDLNETDGLAIFEERSEMDSDPKNPGTFAVKLIVREV